MLAGAVSIYAGGDNGNRVAADRHRRNVIYCLGQINKPKPIQKNENTGTTPKNTALKKAKKAG